MSSPTVHTGPCEVKFEDSTYTVNVLKGAEKSPLESEHSWSPGCDESIYKKVEEMLNAIEKEGEAKALEYAMKLDKWPAEKKTFLLTPEEIEEQIALVPESVRQDIAKQQDRVVSFAKAQLSHMQPFELELSPGTITGQKIVPITTAGCYVPGGRYSHVSSATMTVATAKAAGVKNVVAVSPPMQGKSTMHPATLYAMKRAGADHIMCCGGAHAIGSMAYGLFTGKPADIIVGPGNSFVAEAKRLLFGKVGIDFFAGPTEIMVITDHTADPRIVASDLVSQAEHGPTSPAWCFTTSEDVGKKVAELAPELVKKLPADNPAHISWEKMGQVIVCKSREDMVKLSDRYASEHLEVICEDLQWYHDNLTNYGSLFLGEETCVTYGDKISGPNHALPTLRGGRYTGGLSVDKFVKKLTYQRATRDGNRELGPYAARISRVEGMEAHARAADDRLAKYFPTEEFKLQPEVIP